MIKSAYIFLFLLFSSCTQGSDKTQAKQTEAVTIQDTASYTYNIHKNISSYFVEHDGNVDTAYYQISYPIFQDKALNESLTPFILIDGDESTEIAAESFILGFDEFVEENSTQSIHSPWYKNVTSQVWTNTPLFLTIATAVDEYTGGAHGNHYTVISNINIQDKKKIELKDIIEKDQIPALTKIAEKHFRNNENLSDSASLKEDFFFENGIFAINDNFGLTKKSFIIYYNEYEIRPYVEGPTWLEIPYSDIEKILNPMGQKYIHSLRRSLN